MRDRLIELLEGAEAKASEYIKENDHMDFIPTLKELLGVYADHLLSEGVIVPRERIQQKNLQKKPGTGEQTMEHKCEKTDLKGVEKCELNREQIIKALEYCINNELCDNCPVGVSKCHIIEDALSLIKELAEEKEKLGLLIDELEKEKRELFEENKRLTEENERLRAEISVKKKLLDKCVELEDKVKVDTVREMRSRIKARCISGGIYPAFVENVIYQIAKEMVEEG